MKGTFKPGDKLFIEKAPFEQIKKGDVIIFKRAYEGKNDFIVHRVARITPIRLVTRGDNCRHKDHDFVSKDDTIGRVIRCDRMGKASPVCNGVTGQMRAFILHGRLRATKWLKSVLRKPYIKLRKAGLIAKIWHPDIERFYFESPDGPFVKYLHKGKTVAISREKSKFCLVKRPFDFIFCHFPD